MSSLLRTQVGALGHVYKLADNQFQPYTCSGQQLPLAHSLDEAKEVIRYEMRGQPRPLTD